MWPDQVSNPGPLTYKSGALPTALHGPAQLNIRRDVITMAYCLYPFKHTRVLHFYEMGSYLKPKEYR